MQRTQHLRSSVAHHECLEQGVGTMKSKKLARGLGWFSLGLGATQLLAPKWLGRQIGVGEKTGILRALGARETLTGLTLLVPAKEQRQIGMWGRVLGDVMDVALLG